MKNTITSEHLDDLLAKSTITDTKLGNKRQLSFVSLYLMATKLRGIHIVETGATNESS